MGNHYSIDKIPDLSGKVYVITGANTGIGYVTAREISRKGGHVIMCCRSEERANTAITNIKNELKQAKVDSPGQLENLTLDLMSLKTTHQTAKILLDRNQRIDVLINNAGIMATPFRLTQDGIESQFGTNHMGHFVFTLLLLPLLPRDGTARIINLSSLAHTNPYSSGLLPLEKLQVIESVEKGKKSEAETNYSPWQAYGTSKLANILLTRYLADHLPNIKCYAVHPGVVDTELTRNLADVYGSLVKGLTGWIYLLIAKSPDNGSITSLRAATDPFLDTEEGIKIAPNGTYFVPQGKPQLPSAMAQDPHLAQQLWDLSIAICKRVLGDQVTLELQTNLTA